MIGKLPIFYRSRYTNRASASGYPAMFISRPVEPAANNGHWAAPEVRIAAE